MKPLDIFVEGSNAIDELTSTQTLITTLVNSDNDKSKSEIVNELKTYIELYENILLELENNDEDTAVST